MSDSPTTVVKHVDYVGSFEELLKVSEPPAADLTLFEVVQLPNTMALEDRFAVTVAGPYARLLAQFLVTQAELALQKDKVNPDG